MAKAIRSSENNLETYRLIWLDDSVNNSEENVQTQQRLRSLINHLEIFEESDACEQHIQFLPDQDRIVLIVSGQLGEHIVPRIHQLQQISSIYVYCMNKQTNEIWVKQFPKVIGVVVDLNELVAQIRFDRCVRRRGTKFDEPLLITILNRHFGEGQSTTGLNGQFVHSQLLIDCLLRMESNEIDKNQLISACQQEYDGNDEQLAILREFAQDYSRGRSLWWYTRDSFVHRLLNKALRVQNIDLLFFFRFLIQDLREQLYEHRCSSPLTVYRGQLMSKNELDLLEQSLGEFISFNSFLSTSLDRRLALFFLTDSAHSDLERVLLEIDADPQLDALKPLSNITSLSYVPDEEEVLFMLGSLFRIDSIRHDQSGVWIIRLTLCSSRDNHLKSIFDHLNNENGEGETTLISFSNLLRRMGKLDEAQKYCRRCLDQLPFHDHRNIVRCYHAIGSVAYEKGEYKSSLEWLYKSLEMLMGMAQPDDSDLANTQNCIANVYVKKSDYRRALEFYNKALLTFGRVFGEDHPKAAMCWNNIGVVFEREGKYSEALNYYEKALAIRQKHFPADHPRLGQSHKNIGAIHQVLGHCDIALEHYNLSLEIEKNSLPPQHSYLAKTLKNIGSVYEQKNEWQEALSYYEKSVTIYRHVLPPTHPDVVEIEEDIRRVLSGVSN